MSNSRSSAASRSLVRQLRLARPLVAPMELPICAARNATSSSKSAAASDAVPPARIWLPVRAASPAFPGGSRYAPVRTRTDTSTSGRGVILDDEDGPAAGQRVAVLRRAGRIEVERLERQVARMRGNAGLGRGRGVGRQQQQGQQPRGGPHSPPPSSASRSRTSPMMVSTMSWLSGGAWARI